MASSSKNTPTLEQVLDDVEARFLYNLPNSELEHTERLFFQIEQAYWFYEDFKADVYAHLPHFSNLKSFATKLFSHSALLAKAGDKFQELFSDFRNYKSKIPVYGCIMLNPKMTKVVLVCDYNGKSWTFPRGKINENESEFTCAVREVLEETGFDATPHCREEDNLLAFNEGKQMKLYVACNVPESTAFVIQTRKEISEVAFHSLDALPKSYAVMPFLEKLKRWIAKRKQLNGRMQRSPMNPALKSPGRAAAAVPPAVPRPRRANGGGGGGGGNGGNNNSNTCTSPAFTSASPTFGAMNSSNGNNNGQQASPGTAKRMRNLFDMRNCDTFFEQGDGGGSTSSTNIGWGVNDMFAANAKITGKSYVYDGNPHQFGASHPKYVNYNDAHSSGGGGGGGSSRSLLDSGATVSAFDLRTPNGTIRKAGIASAGANTSSSSCKPGAAAAAVEADPFRALSEQSLLGHRLLRMDKDKLGVKSGTAGQENTSPPPMNNNNNNNSSHAPADFALPKSAFKFDISMFRKQQQQAAAARHDSFDSTHSYEGGDNNNNNYNSNTNMSNNVNEYNSNNDNTVDATGCKVVFPLNFKLDRAAVMAAFDRGMAARAR